MEPLFRGFLQFLSQYFAVIRCNLPPGNFKVRYDNRFLNYFGGNRSRRHSPSCKTKVNEESGVTANEWQAHASLPADAGLTFARL
jgi:hypothetical protein